VELAPVTDPRDVASAVARAMAIPVREGEPAHVVVARRLANREALVVLDNFEHLLGRAGFVADLLARCPRLTILATSRAPLRLAAERLYPVQPLEVPGDGDPSTDLERFAAVAMFCDRARAREPAFDLDERTAPVVGDICRRLDGLPLALELAAARLGILSPADLAARLGSALDVLVGGASDAPQRQRTMRAMIDWSFDLLSMEERRAFARLGVFAGGATVAAAETVTGATLETLESLLAKHLLVRRDDRLMMLETIREHASEQLAHDAGCDEVNRRLAAWCLDVARNATPHLGRADHRSWVAVLDAELPNALASLSWAIERGESELAFELVAEWAPYWWRLGHWAEGARWIDAVLENGEEAGSSARATTLLYRARVATYSEPGGMSHARRRELVNVSLEYFRAVEDAAGIAACLSHLTFHEAVAGRFEAAEALGHEAMRFAERSEDPATLAVVLAETFVGTEDLGDVLSRAGTARQRLMRAGNLLDLARLDLVAGYTALVARRYREAIDWLDQGLDAAGRLQHSWWEFSLRTNRGLANLFLDEPDEAEHDLTAAIGICRAAGAEALLDETVLGLAALAARQGDLERAAHLAGAAHRLEADGQSIEEADVWQRLHVEFLVPATDRLGHTRWNDIERGAFSLTPEEAIEVALTSSTATRGANDHKRAEAHT
jgi:predicted ATPase